MKFRLCVRWFRNLFRLPIDFAEAPSTISEQSQSHATRKEPITMAHASIEGIADSGLPLAERESIIRRIRDVRIANWTMEQSRRNAITMGTIADALLTARVCCVVTPRISDDIADLFSTHFNALDPVWDFVFFEFTEE